MKLVIEKAQLLRVLTPLAGVVERKHTIAILANIKFDLSTTALVVTASDTEVEMVGVLQLTEGMCIEEGSITISARKLLDITKALPAGASISLSVDDGKCVLKSGKSKFVLGTLSAAEFPSLTNHSIEGNCITVGQGSFKKQLEKSAFAMALQDVRYYLTGMLLEVFDGLLRSVSTDGHRLAMSESEASVVGGPDSLQAIVPRKAVLELQKLLLPTDEQQVSVQISPEFLHLSVQLPFNETDLAAELRFTSKLIEGTYPDYRRVMPQNGDKLVTVSHKTLKETLQRVAILGNETLKTVVLHISATNMDISTRNAESDQANDTIDVEYNGSEPIEIIFNVQYLLDILAVLHGDKVVFTLAGSHSTTLINDPDDQSSMYVVMPVRL